MIDATTEYNMATDYDNFLKSIADRIEKLNRMRELDTMPRQTFTRDFAIVSSEEHQIAMNAFIAIAERYSISPEDINALTRAHLILFAHGLSQMEGQWELSSEDVARKVTWQ